MSFELRNSSVLDITFHTAVSSIFSHPMMVSFIFLIDLRVRSEPSPSLNCFQPNQRGHQEEDELFAQTEKFKNLFTKKGPCKENPLEKIV